MADITYCRYGDLGAAAAQAAADTIEGVTGLSPVTSAPRTLTVIQDRRGGAETLLLGVPFTDIADRGLPHFSAASGGAVLTFDDLEGETQMFVAGGGEFPEGVAKISGWFGYGSFTAPLWTIAEANFGAVLTALGGPEASVGLVAPGDVLRIDEELLRVEASVNSTTLTVVRGVGGTVAVDHRFGASVRRLFVPADLNQAAMVIAKRWAATVLAPGAGSYQTADGSPASPGLTYNLGRTLAKYSRKRTLIW